MKNKPLKTCTGGSAEGDKRFFKRVAVIKRLRRKLNNKEHLLISAPRRIGKTSLLKHLRDYPDGNQVVLYLIVQSVNSINEFNKKLCKEIINNEQLWTKLESWYMKTTSTLKSWISRVRGIFIGGGIEIDKEDSVDYYEVLDDLINQLHTHEKQIIIFIDEFPDAITNIIKRDKREALNFFNNNVSYARNIKTQQFSLSTLVRLD